ncbi:MAG: hypothetical protein ABIH39_07400 [Candidatus Margulisiibacteriota bacterium]
MKLKPLFLLLLVTATVSLHAAEPTAEITSPIAGAVIASGSTVTISGTVTGNNYEYFDLYFATGNVSSWSTLGFTVPNTIITTENGFLATWDTTSRDLTTWKLRLRSFTDDGYQKTYYVSSIIDNTSPVIASVAITNLTTSNNAWVKNSDVLLITANISDDKSLITGNIWADLTDFGGGHYTAPDEWISGTSGVASWRVTTNMVKDGYVSLNIFVQDFGNNQASQNAVTTADITVPEIDVYINGEKVFSGDFFASDIALSGSVSENNSVTSFSLTFYRDGAMFGTASNNNGADLVLSFPTINSRALTIVAVACDSAGNITTENLTSLASTTTFILSEVLCAPNPFNPNHELSHIGYKLSQAAAMKLYIHSITGELIYTAQKDSTLGYDEFTWDGMGQYGQVVPNGLYLGVVIARSTDGKEEKAITKIALLK